MLYQQVEESIQYILSRISSNAKHAIVLGTGLNSLIHNVVIEYELEYKNIPHFPKSTVQSHAGKLLFGKINSTPVIIMAGRFHYYEGYNMKEVTFPIRVLKGLGISHLILSNAAGGINPHYSEGDIVMIEDHINMLPEHPLKGANEERWGVRFPDMMHVYDSDINETMMQLAKKHTIDLKKGVYLALQGPSLETPAEYKMAHIIGADLVGMSTVPEVIVAKHAGMKVTVFSIVSNICYPKSNLSETTIDDVIQVVNQASSVLNTLLLAYFENYKHR